MNGFAFAALLGGIFTVVIGFVAYAEHHDRTDVGTVVAVESKRFKVEYNGSFNCGDNDRENRRAMYVITDSVTGVSYLAVQGCGTSQLVTETNMVGKVITTTTVER
jgi:hypothetical protein